MTTKDTRRLALCAAGLAGLALSATPAVAAAPKARLAATSISTPPTSLVPGDRFTAKGSVRNTGRGAGLTQLSFKLRTAEYPYVSISLGGGRTASIAAGKSRAFSVPLRVASPPNAVQARKGYVLVVCVSRRRGETGVCRKSSKAVTVKPDPTLTAQPAAAPAPTPAATVTTTTATPPPIPPPLGTVPATGPSSGARSLGDTLFPTIGNGGYDAVHYDLDLGYDIERKLLTGSSTARMVATQQLGDFSFDLASYVTAQSVEVNGVQARFAQDYANDKLVVIPETPIADGATFTTKVTYRCVEQAYLDPDGSSEGWVPDTERGAIVVSEPVGAMGWFPNNNVPFDKATYTIKMAVPELAADEEPWRVVGTGVQVGEPVVADGKRTYTWDDTDPTASYLVSVAIGKFDVSTTLTTPTASNPLTTPFVTAVDSSFLAPNKANQLTGLNRTPAILDYFADYYRVRYPFTSKGGIIPRIPVGYSLETQSKPVYAGSTAENYNGPAITTIAHENAHMYFGDSTTLTQWKDIWINEGMTQFTTVLWNERQNAGAGNTGTLASYFATRYNRSTPTAFWNIPPAAPPTAADIFDNSAMYQRGAMTMIGVKDVFGEEPFRALMNEYLTDPKHLNGNSTTEEFIALVKAEDAAIRAAAGLPDRTERWTEYFRQWLYTPYTGTPTATANKPQLTAANFDTYALP